MTVLLIAVGLVLLGWGLVWRLVVWGCEDSLMTQRKRKWFQQ